MRQKKDNRNDSIFFAASIINAIESTKFSKWYGKKYSCQKENSKNHEKMSSRNIKYKKKVE